MSYRDLVVSKWQARFMGQIFPVSIGRNGIGEKQGEGDPTTPQGVFEIENWLYRPDRLQAPFSKIHVQDGWSDDPADPHYNQRITRPYGFSHERLARADHLYDLIGVMNFNRNPVQRGAGSAIFLHAWRRPRFPTEGCIALDPNHLRFVAKNWQASSRVVVQ